jgi:uncharacterized membrane protein
VQVEGWACEKWEEQQQRRKTNYILTISIMDLSTYQILLAIGIFLFTTFILIKLNYRRYEKEYGRKWKIDGFRTGYFRVMVLLGFAITVVCMLILKNTILH